MLHGNTISIMQLAVQIFHYSMLLCNSCRIVLYLHSMGKLTVIVITLAFPINPQCIPLAVDEWGDWSHCTRICGGGVSVQERDCL